LEKSKKTNVTVKYAEKNQTSSSENKPQNKNRIEEGGRRGRGRGRGRQGKRSGGKDFFGVENGHTITPKNYEISVKNLETNECFTVEMTEEQLKQHILPLQRIAVN